MGLYAFLLLVRTSKQKRLTTRWKLDEVFGYKESDFDLDTKKSSVCIERNIVANDKWSDQTLTTDINHWHQPGFYWKTCSTGRLLCL